MKEKSKYPSFSNGTEFMFWTTCNGKEELNEDESFVNTFSSFLAEAISTMEE